MSESKKLYQIDQGKEFGKWTDPVSKLALTNHHTFILNLISSLIDITTFSIDFT